MPETASRHRGWTATAIAGGFFVVYLALFIAGRGFIAYPDLHWVTILSSFVFVCCFLLGTRWGETIGKFRKREISERFIDRTLWVLGIGVTATTGLVWLATISQFGSLTMVLAQANTIREATIGQGDSGIVPVPVQYFNSLIYALFALSLVRLGHTRRYTFTLAAAYFFILIVLSDLTQFGRIGILYGIFCVIGYTLVYNVRVVTVRNLTAITVLFGLLMLPRLIRGSFDNFEASMQHYRPYIEVEVPPELNAGIITYIYYFSAPYALDRYFLEKEESRSMGYRTFTPLYNILSRFTGDTRVATIDDVVDVPFPYNIYTVVKDFYQDFGIWGLSLLPTLAGLYFGRLFLSCGTGYDAVKIFALGWLFYTPIYNAFSFGGFLISFLFLVILASVGARSSTSAPVAVPAA